MSELVYKAVASSQLKPIEDKCRRIVEEKGRLWLEGGDLNVLREYLQVFFSPLMGKDKQIDDNLFSSRFMPEWAKVFTHPSYNSSENYDIYEKLGDAAAKLYLIKYIRKYHKDVSTPGSISIQVDINLSNEKLGEISTKYGLLAMLRMGKDEKGKDEKITVKIGGDVLEALFGCLNETIDEVSSVNGMGAVYSYNFLIMLSVYFKIDANQKRDAKTHVKEIYDALGKTQPRQKKDQIGLQRIRITVFDPDTGDTMGVGEGPDGGKEARENAYLQTLEYLRNKGLTDDRIKEIKVQKNRLDPIYDAQYSRMMKALDQLNRKLQMEDTEIIDFTVEAVKDKGINAYSLYLISRNREDGIVRKLLQDQIQGDNNRAVAIQLMKKYADSAGIPSIDR